MTMLTLIQKEGSSSIEDLPSFYFIKIIVITEEIRALI